MLSVFSMVWCNDLDSSSCVAVQQWSTELFDLFFNIHLAKQVHQPINDLWLAGGCATGYFYFVSSRMNGLDVFFFFFMFFQFCLQNSLHFLLLLLLLARFCTRKNTNAECVCVCVCVELCSKFYFVVIISAKENQPNTLDDSSNYRTPAMPRCGFVSVECHVWFEVVICRCSSLLEGLCVGNDRKRHSLPFLECYLTMSESLIGPVIDTSSNQEWWMPRRRRSRSALGSIHLMDKECD